MEKVELAKAYVQIVPSAQGIKGSISNVLEPEADASGKKAGSSIASKIKGAIVAAGIGKALQATIMEGANLEQSIGGIETLFKDSADTVRKYAEEAYKTVGVSANSYMQQVTSFSASLLQSLGGDTAKSAEVANMAMIDMSDNANKMGTSMEMIQNAYQGFAKQNYTMLDNLKLGYGGTKTEMERLLKDAQKLTGVKYDISNLSDVYNAIHVIQEELGITGTTAKEASETVIGSFNAMKASLSNLMGSMALGKNVGASLKALLQTTSTFLFGNLLPMIGTVIAQIPQIIGEGGIQLWFSGIQMMEQIGQGFVSSFPTMIDNLLGMLEQMSAFLTTNAPLLISKGFEMLSNLVDGIISALPTMIERLPAIISTFANVINDNAPVVLKKGFDLLVQFIMGILSAIPTLIQNIPQIIQAIVDTIMSFQWLDLGKNIIDSFGNGIKSMVEFIKDSTKSILNGITTTLQNLPQTLFNLGKSAFSNMGNAISNTLGFIKEKALSIVKGITDVIGQLPSKLLTIGGDMIKGLWNGISDMTGWILDKIGGFAGGIIDSVKNMFGIHSPSRLFRDEIGKFLPMGLAVGITDNMKPVDEAMAKLEAQTMGVIDTNIDNTPRNYANVSSNSQVMELLSVLVDGDRNNHHIISRLYDLLAELLPLLANMKVVLDTGVLAGELINPIDEGLGTLNRRKGR